MPYNLTYMWNLKKKIPNIQTEKWLPEVGGIEGGGQNG